MQLFHEKIFQTFVIGSFVVATIFLSGCTSLGMMGGYPSEMSGVKDKIKNGNLDKAYAQMAPRAKGADKVLYLQERGRIASLNEEYSKSIADLGKAAALIEEYRMGAYISLSDTSAQAASLFLNDTVIPYSGYEYEKVFIHAFQIENYLARDDLEGALVEVRKAQNEQTYAAQQRSKEIAKAQEASKTHNIDWSDKNPGLKDVYRSLNVAAGNTKESFLNGYVFALSGVLYEIAGQYNDALIAYKKALELYPYNEYLEQAIERNGQKSGIGSWTNTGPRQQDTGRLVVFYQDGFVVPRTQISVPIFWNERSYTISMPLYYGQEDSGSFPLSISAGGKKLGNTALVCNTSSLAARALEEAYPGIIIRQILRLIVKDQVQKQIQDEYQEIAPLVAIANYFVDNADRRSWLTLPQAVQMAEFELSPGKHVIKFEGQGIGQEQVIDVKRGKITVLRLVRAGNTVLWTQLWQG